MDCKMKQKAIRIKSIGENTYNPDLQVMLIGGELDGQTMYIDIAQDRYKLDLEIYKDRLALVENGFLRYTNL